MSLLPLLLLLLPAGLPGTASGAGSVRLIPAAGINWSVPLDTAVRDQYAGGLGASFDLGVAVSPVFRVSAVGQWLRKSGTPEFGMARVAASRLTLVPLLGEVSAHARRRTLRPFASAGLGVVLVRERFSYATFEETHVLSGSRTDAAASLGAGIETPLKGSLLRLSFRALLTGGSRHVLRPGAPEITHSKAATSSLFTISAEFAREVASFRTGKE